MRNYQFGLLLLLGSFVLASCGQQAVSETAAAPTSVAGQIAEFAQRPELQDAQTQSLLKAYADDPQMLDALQRAYGLKADSALNLPDSAITAQDTRLSYVQGIAWGSVAHFRTEKAHPKYSGLNWSSDGCSAPSGVGLGYRDTFRPACDVHDFGYGNLPKMTARSQWEGQRANTDNAFHHNMDQICSTQSWYKKPPCYVASQAYYVAVSSFGGSHWH